MSKIKAVIMDGDGSTLTVNNELPESLRGLILSYPQLKWIMATGRSLELLFKTPIAKYLTTDVARIVDGGSKLMFTNGHIVQSNEISLKELKHFFKIIVPKLSHVNFIYYSPDGITAYAYSSDVDFASKFKFNGINISYTNSIAEFANYTYNFPPTKLLLNVCQDIDLDGMYYHKNENNIDITANNVNKGTACVELLKILNITPHEAVFVFNDKNDL